MKKKIVSLCLVLALVVTAIGGATLAYFTDTKTATNTFTVGNVKIDLIESQLHRSNASGNPLMATTDTTLIDQMVAADATSNAHGWSGTYFPDAVIKTDAANYLATTGYLATEGKNMVPGRSVHKNPYIVNTGANAAYVRTRVLIPVSLFNILDEGPSCWVTTALNAGEITSKAVDFYNALTVPTGSTYAEVFAASTGADAFKVSRGGVDYYQFDFTYTKALQPNEMTFWNCWTNIRIDPDATSADLAAVESFKVIVEADAIQAEGFATAADAFAAFDAA